jgi:hypothetical protein
MNQYSKLTTELILGKVRTFSFRRRDQTVSVLHMISSEVDSRVNAKAGRAVAQAVSRWLPTAAARVQTRV